MCSISGSFNTDKLKELIELNSYRGSYSHSIAYYNPSEKKFDYLQKAFGKPNLSNINIPVDHYAICHVQAPTTEMTDDSSIHPSILSDNGEMTLLWHNGILKPSTISTLQVSHDTDCKWDTRLLHYDINGLSPGQIIRALEEVDGSFSCVYADSFFGIRLFRNAISPMFVDDDLNISSTKFNNSRPTMADHISVMDFKENKLEPMGCFKTVNNPYWLGD